MSHSIAACLKSLSEYGITRSEQMGVNGLLGLLYGLLSICNITW
jgi:hypothetical protein